jgi:hypothetical protein
MIARHPRFILVVGFLILCTFLLLASSDSIPSRKDSTVRINAVDHGLKERLAYSEEVYQSVLEQRKGLIQKYGPTVDKIDMFVH